MSWFNGIAFRGYAKEKYNTTQWFKGHGVYEVLFADDYARKIGRESDLYLLTENGEILVYPESIGRYTGLFDMNGKGICENDILEFESGNQDKTYHVVKYEDGAFYAVLCTTNGTMRVLLSNLAKSVKVVGNTFENKDMLGDSYNG